MNEIINDGSESADATQYEEAEEDEGEEEEDAAEMKMKRGTLILGWGRTIRAR
jgi:hypothetical protein